MDDNYPSSNNETGTFQIIGYKRKIQKTKKLDYFKIMVPTTKTSEKKENPYKEVEVAKWVDEQVETLRTFSSVGSE